jgi:START domain
MKAIINEVSNRRKNILFILILWGAYFPANAQGVWELKKDKNGIKVYSRSNDHSKFNELKVETILQGRLSNLAAVIMDIPAYPAWSFNVKASKVLRQISPAEVYFYTEISSPWPAENRDLPIHLHITQNPVTKVMTIAVQCIPELIPHVKNIVRVPVSKETWTVTPVDKGSIRIDYQAEVDPGADPPGWLINLFSVKGPYETFTRLRDQILLPKYKAAVVSFITN